MPANTLKYEEQKIELRTGIPYANLILQQTRCSQVLGAYLDIDPQDTIPMPGTTGAIEAVRNHV